VLGHPFYVRWSAGTLTAEDLSTYAAQYAYAVRALACAAAHAARIAPLGHRGALARHAAEESEHVRLWRDFAKAVGAPDDPATSETRACVKAWSDEDRDFDESLIALFAIESVQPRIAATKLDGLVRNYGVSSPRAVAYFEIHAERDKAHAAATRWLLQERGAAARPKLAAIATDVWKTNWGLLDGVERVIAERETPDAVA
jgi:pyrroloquinoline quinone (PQQ) biosynthesis protein C